MIKIVQASTNLPRFHTSGTNLCNLSETPCNNYAAMVIKCIIKGNNTHKVTLEAALCID